MSNSNHKPVTRAELRSELESKLRDYPTKKELRSILESKLRDYPTKKELRSELESKLRDYPTKKDLEAFAQRIVLKIGELMDRVDALREQSATKAEMRGYASAVERVSKDNELLWNKDIVQDERLRGLEDQGRRHADRISSLEGETSP